MQKKGRMRRSRIQGLVLVVVMAAAPAWGIALGQLDDFQDGTVKFWAGGSGSGSPAPLNLPNGGPDGMGDRYLQLTATNSNLGMNNTAQWTGNYNTAGVAKIRFFLNNTGANPLHLRLSIFGAGGTFTTTNETVLDPASGWVIVDFVLDSASLTQTAGFGTLANTLTSVTTVLLRHDPDPISGSGSPNPVTGQLGIDNIRALPEPSAWTGLCAGIAALWLGSRARRCARDRRSDTAAPRARPHRAGAAGAAPR
jgi:hypothetical protein